MPPPERLHNDRLAETLLHFVAERAHEDVARAARAVGGDDADGLGRIGLCIRGGGCHEGNERSENCKHFHGVIQSFGSHSFAPGTNV